MINKMTVSNQMVRSSLIIGFAVFMTTLFAVGVIEAASTISTNISTDGTLTVNGSSTFGDAAADVNLFTGLVRASSTALFTGNVTTYGNATFGNAAADVNLFTGLIRASSTSLFTGNVTTYGNATFGDAATDVNIFTGTLNASTTALFTSGFTTYGAVVFNENSADVDFRLESNGEADMLVVDGGLDRVGIASTTPTETFSVDGDAWLASAATTTVTVRSTGATQGGCIQLEGANDTMYRLYVGTAGTLTTEAGSCQ